MPVKTEAKEVAGAIAQKSEREDSPVVSILNWLLFTVGAAYLLLLAKLAVGRLFLQLTPSAVDCMSEIMFAVIVIFAEALHMMFIVKTEHGSFEQAFRLLVGVFSFVGIFLSAIIFGILLTPTGNNLDEPSAKSIAMGLMIMSFAFGASMQVYSIVGRVRKEDIHV